MQSLPQSHTSNTDATWESITTPFDCPFSKTFLSECADKNPLLFKIETEWSGFDSHNIFVSISNEARVGSSRVINLHIEDFHGGHVGGLKQ